jgi:hypothetical protein
MEQIRSVVTLYICTLHEMSFSIYFCIVFKWTASFTTLRDDYQTIITLIAQSVGIMENIFPIAERIINLYLAQNRNRVLNEYKPN